QGRTAHSSLAYLILDDSAGSYIDRGLRSERTRRQQLLYAGELSGEEKRTRQQSWQRPTGPVAATKLHDPARWMRERDPVGTNPSVWNNDSVDGSFGITSKIFLDQITASGSLVSTLEVPNSSQNEVPPTKDQMVTSFSSKSELAPNLSLDHQ